MTKIEKVKNHLINNGTITSWEAIQLYRATRLSAIIYDLRYRYDMNIKTIKKQGTTEDGDKYPYAEYVLMEDNNG
jgi:hypothetical protein